MCRARHSGVEGVAKNRGAELLRPAQPLELADANKWVLFRRGMALIVEVVEQRRGRVPLDERGAGVALKPEPVGFLFAVSHNASFNSHRVLAQAFTLCPLGKKLPCLRSIEAGGKVCVGSHFCLLFISVVRVSSGFAGTDPAFSGLTLIFYLTIMVRS